VSKLSENLMKEIFSELELLEFQIHKAEMAHYARVKDHAYHIQLCEKFGIYCLSNLTFRKITQ